MCKHMFSFGERMLLDFDIRDVGLSNSLTRPITLRCCVLNKVFLVNHWRNILNCRCKWLCSVILIMHRLKNISFASLECAILNDIRYITNVLEISNLFKFLWAGPAKVFDLQLLRVNISLFLYCIIVQHVVCVSVVSRR